MPPLRRRKIWLAIAGAISVGAPAQAQITTDGTLGAAQALAGPNYAIPASLGRQAGGNLFHSFGQFNVPTAGSATFSGSGTVSNIISRVTGGQTSSIDGVLRSTIAGANLFLINPYGILFGPKATLELTGSFTASTASYLKLADGTRFEATATVNPILTSAPPAAFGFLGPTEPITVQGSQLQVASGKSINLVGGPVTLSDASLRTTAGDIRIVGVGGAGEVSLGGDVTPGTALAPVLIQRSDLSTGSADGAPPGRILIRGGQLTVVESDLASTNNEEGDASPVELAASGDLTVSASNVTSETGWSGRGADIVLGGENVTVEHNSQVGSITSSDGRGGDIRLTASGAARVLAAPEDHDFTAVFSETYGTGMAGDLRLRGDPVIVSAPLLYSYTAGAGRTGSIVLRGRDIDITRGAYVTTQSDWGTTGGTGNIDIAATRRLVTGGADWTGFTTIVFTQTLGSGRGGDILLRGEDISVVDGGRIISIGAGSGRGGDIDIAASRRFYASNGIPVPHEQQWNNGIYSQTFGAGDAGNIGIAAPEITLLGSFVHSGAHDAGNAGTLRFDGDVVRFLGGNGNIAFLESGASNFSAGSGGNIEVRARSRFELSGVAFTQDWTRMAATTQGAGRGGEIIVESPQILIEQATIFSRTRFGTGDQGGIILRGEDVRLQNFGEIGSLTEGDRKGSFVLVEARSVALSDASIIYASTGGSGDAGQVTINAQRLRLTGASSVQAGSGAGSGNAGDIVLNIGESLEITERRPTLAGFFFAPRGLAWPGGLATQASGSGDAGRIIVRAPSILLDDARILSTARQSGQGGRVEIHADRLVMRNGAQIDARSAEGSTGDAGAIDLAVAGRFEISGRSPIDGALSGLYAETQGTGRGGSLGVAADALVVDGGLIRSSTSAGGDAGTIHIRAGDVVLVNGGWIDAGAAKESTGAGGSIDLAATRSLVVRGADRTPVALSLNELQPLGITPGTPGRPQGAFPSTISSNTAGRGAGGNISLSAPRIDVADGGRIDATSTDTGTAGPIAIAASDALRLFGGTISSEALNADGGNIDIRVGNLVHLRNSEITTAVGSGAGAGGNIFIDPTFVILENSRIAANAFGGPGGNIQVFATYFLNTLNSLVDASSQAGVPGTVSISAPNTNLSTQIKVLPATFFDATQLVREACAGRVASGNGGSSLVGVGRGGLAASPERFATSTYFGDAPAAVSSVPAATGLKLSTAKQARIAGCSG